MRRFFKACAIALAVCGTASQVFADDQQVAQQMARQLSASGKLQGYRIQVKVQDSTAWLEGSVRTEAQMRDAMKVANSTPGIKRVVNNLSIDSSRPTGGYGVRQVTANDPEQLLAMGADAPIGKPVPQAMPARGGYAPAGGPPGAYGPGPGAYGAAGGPPGGYVPQMASAPMPAYPPGVGGGVAPARYDQPNMPGYAWPSYAAYPNYAAVSYPRQYSATAWPFIGPFYPYPQVPLGWRKVSLEWDDGWWWLDFKD